MKKLFVLFISVFIVVICSKAQIIYSPNNHIEYHVGTVPIVLSAPHGGGLEPTNIPDRTCNNPTTVRDSRTRELALAIDSMFHLRTGCRIHLIVCNLRRTKLDCNRDITDGACGNQDAEVAWTAFQSYVDSARLLSESNFAENFYIDLHGHGHTKQRLELGYLLSGSRLRNSDSTLNTPTFIGYSSIQNMVSSNVNNYSHAQLLRGQQALGTLLQNSGYPSVPSMQDIHPDTTDPYFSGGHNTREHTCATPNVSANGVQIECNWTGVRDTKANRIKFADSLSTVLISYLNHHFNMNLGFCAPTAMGSVSKNKLLVYPSILSAGETLHLKNNFQNVDYKIYNLTGSVVQEGKTSNSIPTKNDLAPATYFMQLKSKYEIYRTKIIIQ
jgi:hypothetical protein